MYNIAFSCWKNHHLEIIPEQVEINKFNQIKKVFKPFSIFDSIREIYPNIDLDVQLQNTFKAMLRVGSLPYDQVMQWS